MSLQEELERASHAELVRLCGAEASLRKRYEGALRDLVEVVNAERVEGTCRIGTCHWPAVHRQAILAQEDLGE